MPLNSEPRHARACPGHPRLNSLTARKTWIMGTSSASWFETRGVAALLTMRIGEPHPEERALAGVSKDGTPVLPNALARKSAGDGFLEDLPADLLVGEGRRAPPPAVLLHFLRRGHEALRHLGKISLGVVQAEDQAAGPDPAQCEALEAQIILKHPVGARRPGVMDHPDRRKVADPDRQIVFGQRFIQAPRPSVPGVIESVI